MLLKKILRTEILEKRKLFNKEKYFPENNEIFKSVQNLLSAVSKDDDVIGLYWPTHGEPDLLHIVKNYKKHISIPRLKGVWMDFFHYNETSIVEKSGIGDLMQPKTNKKLQPDVVVLPAIAFSVNGNRLGFGSGHYDRYFHNNPNKEIIKIGVCFHEHLYEDLPRESHDIQLDYIITDKIIIAL